MTSFVMGKANIGWKIRNPWLHLVKEIKVEAYPFHPSFKVAQHFMSITMGDGPRKRNPDLKLSYKIVNDGKPARVSLLLDNETEQGEWHTLDVENKSLDEVKEDLDYHRFVMTSNACLRELNEIEEDPFEAIAEQMRIEKEKKGDNRDGLKSFEDEELSMVKARNKARKGKE